MKMQIARITYTRSKCLSSQIVDIVSHTADKTTRFFPFFHLFFRSSKNSVTFYIELRKLFTILKNILHKENYYQKRTLLYIGCRRRENSYPCPHLGNTNVVNEVSLQDSSQTQTSFNKSHCSLRPARRSKLDSKTEQTHVNAYSSVVTAVPLSIRLFFKIYLIDGLNKILDQKNFYQEDYLPLNDAF